MFTSGWAAFLKRCIWNSHRWQLFGYEWPGRTSKLFCYAAGAWSLTLTICHLLRICSNVKATPWHPLIDANRSLGPHTNTNNIYVHNCCFLCCTPLPPPPHPSTSSRCPCVHSVALVSWYSGWVVLKWTCPLTASDKLSGLLISITTTRLACPACMVASTLNFISKSFCFISIWWNNDGKVCVAWLSPFDDGQLISNS